MRKSQSSPETDLQVLIERLDMHLHDQAILCTALEAVADSLPDRLDTQHCLVLARQIPAIMRSAHRFEEDQLFHAMTARCSDEIRATLERLRFEHWEDEVYADELSEALTEYATGLDRSNADALAYMLRGFFEGLRRHIAFEAEHIRPMLDNIRRS